MLEIEQPGMRYRPSERINRYTVDGVFFDLDSTLARIEGIDELAAMCNTAHLIRPLTARAMNGEISFTDVFMQRLAIIRPRHQDLQQLGKRYCEEVTHGAWKAVNELMRHNKSVYVISGGFNPAVTMLTRMLGIPDSHVFANELDFNPDGSYNGLVTDPARVTYPLWTDEGKNMAVTDLMRQHPGRYAFVGDSKGDKQAGTLAGRFICYAGVVARPAAMEQTAYVVTDEDLSRVLDYLQ